MGAYFKVYEGGAYSKEQYFVFFTAVFNRLLVPDHLRHCEVKGLKSLREIIVHINIWRAYQKVGPRNLRWNPGFRTLK